MLTSKEKLREAERLFEEENYVEALKLLNELEVENPGEKKVAYGRAMCLAKLGHFADAMLLCDELLARYRDEKAKILKEKIMKWAEETTELPKPIPIEKEEAKRFTSPIWGYLKRALAVLFLLISITLPFVGWWCLMLAISKDWIPVTFATTLTLAILWPLFIQGMFWKSLHAIRNYTLGDTPILSVIYWLMDTLLLSLLGIFPFLGWILGGWYLYAKREMYFSSGVAVMMLSHLLLWLSFLGVVGSIGLGGWAWILSPIILRL